MTVPFSPTLDLASYVGQRSSTFIFRLQDRVSGQQLGEVHPLRESAPTLTHDTTRTIKRQLSPVTLGVADSREINPLRQRINLSMLLGGVEYPLGQYMFTDRTAMQWTSGEITSCALVDEMFIIDQEMQESFAANTLSVETVEQAIERLLTPFEGQFVTDIEPSGTQATGTWAAGTSRAKALSDLCTQGGYFAPWFNNEGVLKIIRSFEPAGRIPQLDFDTGNQVIRGSITNTDDLLNAPNRFVVISNSPQGGATSQPSVGVYNVPNSAPHSIINRGIVIPDVIDMQVANALQAQDAATAIGISRTVYERTDLATAIDPRHDSYDVIRWQGQQWLELSWSMPLEPGGQMRHLLRKAYS